MADHLEQQTTVRRGLTRRKVVLFVGLLVLIGGSGLFSFAAANGLVNFPSVAIAPRDLTATATAAAHAYTAGTTKTGVMDGLDPAHTHWNPYEKVLNTTNIPHLAPLWSYDTGFSLTNGSSPTVANGIVYISSGKLYAFDANCHRSCQPLWSYSMGGIVGTGLPKNKSSQEIHRSPSPDGTIKNLEVPTSSSPAVANGIVYVTSVAGKLYAFDANCRSACQPLWSYAMGLSFQDSDSSPTVTNGIVYISLNSFESNEDIVGKLYAFDANCRSACQPLWSYTTGPIFSSPTAANGIVYIGSQDDKLYAFDANCRSACQPLWSYDTGKTRLISPTVANGIVYVGSWHLPQFGATNKLYAFDANCRSACQPLWSYTINGWIWASPTVANGIVYVSSQTINPTGGKLYAFDANCRSACQPLWSYATGKALLSSPTVVNGVIYVCSQNGELYAFGLAVK